MRVTVGQTSQFITISLPASIPKVNWKHSSNQYRTHPLCLFASVCWFGERRELYLDLNLVALVSCLIFLSLLYFYFNVAQFLLLLPCFFFSLSPAFRAKSRIIFQIWLWGTVSWQPTVENRCPVGSFFSWLADEKKHECFSLNTFFFFICFHHQTVK
jgi:hypothetical protein